MKTCPKLGSVVSLTDNDSRSRKSSTRNKFALRFIRSLMEMKRRGHVSSSSSSSSNTDNNNVSSAEERSQRIKVAAYSSMAHAVGPRRAWARALIFKLRRRAKRRRVLRKMNRSKSLTCFLLKKKKKTKLKKKRVIDYDHEDDVFSQTDRLRGLVPGGKAMDICSLFDETAHFIMCLATQVKVMQDIADHLSSK